MGGVAYHTSSLSTLSPHIMASEIRTLNAQARQTCLAHSSLTSYASAWNSWIRCANFYGFSALCLTPSHTPIPLADCANYIDLYIGFECGLRQMSPKSIGTVYLPGIAKTFDMSRTFNFFRDAVNHKITQCLLDGYTRAWDKKHPQHQRVKIPFTSALALQAELSMKSGAIPLVNFSPTLHPQTHQMYVIRMTCALLFGIFFLLRKGEFLPKLAVVNCHHIPMRKSHLRFLDEKHSVIPYHLIGHHRASWLTITITFSKTDQTGRGRIVTHHVDTANSCQCIVQRMEAYYLIARDHFGSLDSSLLFDIPGLHTLTTTCITTVMRATCRILGLPEDKVSAHSLRYGGATTLAAAGFPEYIIAFYGGWAHNSTAMRRYIKPSADVVRRVSLQMSRAQPSMAVDSMVNQLLALSVPPSIG